MRKGTAANSRFGEYELELSWPISPIVAFITNKWDNLFRQNPSRGRGEPLIEILSAVK